jgi:8-oxo-dGTP pyrophosphatase MutT (NUDIX family)
MPEVVIAAGGVIFRIQPSGLEVVLIRRNGLWDLPKGAKEAGETVPHSASREVSEELGIGVPSLVKYLCETHHQYPSHDEIFEKHTHWYAMVIAQHESVEFHPQAEEGIEEIRWVNIDEAMDLVAFDNLRRVLSELKRMK